MKGPLIIAASVFPYPFSAKNKDSSKAMELNISTIEGTKKQELYSLDQVKLGNVGNSK